MKWYGIEIKKFCGALVGSNAPILLPEFDMLVSKVKRVFNVLCTTSDVEVANVIFNKKDKHFGVSFIENDLEVVNVAFMKNNKQFVVDYE